MPSVTKGSSHEFNSGPLTFDCISLSLATQNINIFVYMFTYILYKEAVPRNVDFTEILLKFLTEEFIYF